MFYSHPNIKPFNLNLLDFPVSNGSRNHAATTDKGDFIDMRFSSGWLTVTVTKKGGKPTIITEQRIAPFGVTDILPEQLCYILSLAVKGKAVTYPYKKMESASGAARYIDLSGKTTLWQKSVLTTLHHDIGEFVDDLVNMFPEAVLIQTEWFHSSKSSRNRQVPFIIDDDRSTLVGIGLKDFDLAKFDRKSVNFPFYISLNLNNLSANGLGYLKDILLRDKKNLNFKCHALKQYTLSTKFQSNDKYANDCMQKILELTNRYFYNKFQAYDLETHKNVNNNLIDLTFKELPSVSYKAFNWANEENGRYSYVSYQRDKEPHFWGLKPLKNKSTSQTK